MLSTAAVISVQNLSADDRVDIPKLIKKLNQDKTITKEKESTGKLFQEINNLTSPQQLELLTKSAQALLSLSNDSNYHITYVNWLDKQIDKYSDKQEIKNILESAIKEELYTIAKSGHYTLLQNTVVKPLLNTYTKLAKHNDSEPQVLKKTLEGLIDFQYCSYFYLDYKKNEELHPDFLILFDIVASGINKLKDSSEKENLQMQVLYAVPLGPHSPLRMYRKGEGEKEAVDRLFALYRKDYISRLSDLYCNSQKDFNKKEFLRFMGALLNSSDSEYIGKDLPPEVMVQLIDINLNYFEKNIKCIVETYKKSNNRNIKSETNEQLKELYLSFNRLFGAQYLTQCFQSTKVVNTTSASSINLKYCPELQKQISKIENWFNEKISKDISEVILLSLEDELLRTKQVDAIKNWRFFNEQLMRIVRSPKSHEIIRELLVNKLKQDENNPQLREMFYETLSKTMIKPNEEYPTIISAIKNGIIKEQSSQAICGIGKVLFFGTINNLNSKKEASFFKGLKDQDYRIAVTPSEVTGFHKLHLDLIRILDGSADVVKSYLPDIGNGGKLTQEDIQALFKLRKNAFLTLAYSTSTNPELFQDEYVDLMINLLEKRIERYGASDALPKTWGEQVAALISVYSNKKTTLSESNIYVNSKMGFLKGQLFDGIAKTYDIEGEKKTYITIPLFNRIVENEFIKLNPTENRKILYDLDKIPRTGDELREALFKEAPQLQVKYIEMRKQFALAFVNVTQTCNKSDIRESLNDLRQLGFRDYEIRNIAEALLEKKETTK